MKEIVISDKKAYLEKEFPFEDVPKLTDKRKCIHCGKIIVVGDYKVYKDEYGDEYICCPNTPDCNGTIIDWVDPQ